MGMKPKLRLFGALISTVIITGAIGGTFLARNASGTPIALDEPAYSLVLDSSNTPPDSTGLFGNHETTINGTNIIYYGAMGSNEYHIVLNDTGYLMNSLSTRITSITSVSAEFIAEDTASLTLSTSFDGLEFSSTTIESTVINYTSSLPYFLRLSANGGNISIRNVTITYSCVTHDLPIVEDPDASLVIKDFVSPDPNVDLSTNIASDPNGFFQTEGIDLVSFSGAEIYAGVSPQTDFFVVGSDDAAGRLRFTFTPMYISGIMVDAKRHGVAVSDLQVSTNVDNDGETHEIEDRDDYLFTFAAQTRSLATSLTIRGLDAEFELYGIAIYSSDTPRNAPLESGFSAQDHRADDYRTTDIYDLTNELEVRAAMTSGPALVLEKGNGITGYTYKMYNASGALVNTNEAFPAAGDYRLEVRYKNYPVVAISIKVSPAGETPAKLYSLLALDARHTYYAGEVFNQSNQLAVAATYGNHISEFLTYDPSGTNGYSITCLDPNGDYFYPSNPFSLLGTYAYTVEYLGVESSLIEFTVQNALAPTIEANITVLNSTQSHTDNLNISGDYANYFSQTNVIVDKVQTTNLFGGDNQPRWKLGATQAAGSLEFTFKDPVIIAGVALSVEQFAGQNAAATATVNELEQTMQVLPGINTLAYNNFTYNTVPTNALRITTAAGSEFFLREISLQIIPATSVAVESIELDATLSLDVGAVKQLTPTILPSQANPYQLFWESSDNAIVGVTNGIVMGKSVGQATIKVTSKNGNISAECLVKVDKPAFTDYYLPSEVDANFSLQDLKRRMPYGETGEAPNAIPVDQTVVDLLVLPVEFSDYQFSATTINDFDRVFNGTPEETKYWESLSSYYYKSSFGKIKLEFTIAPVYETGYTALEASQLDTSETNYFSTNILREAVDDYKAKNGDTATQRFDSDQDGYIDAVMLIYSCPDYSASSTIRSYSTDYWAYVYYDYRQDANLSSPNQNAYFWCSYDFMYAGIAPGSGAVDAHTFIHESGHLFGFDDFYNYDDFDGEQFRPTGGIDMMDHNIIDHNAWSKMLLGWTKPYVVTGDAEITINPAESSGDSILIADHWNGTSYDEFLMLELYTPTGLNTLDSHQIYNGNSGGGLLGYTQPGVRMFHIDSRIRSLLHLGDGLYDLGWFDDDEMAFSTDGNYMIAHSNSESRALVEPEYKLINMIQAGGVNTFLKGGYGSNADLFKTGDIFDMGDFGTAFFPNGATLNNGNVLGYRIEFIDIGMDAATIRITRV